MKKYSWIFWLPVIGEIYLIIAWVIEDKYPLSISPIFTGVYQGMWVGLLISIILFN